MTIIGIVSVVFAVLTVGLGGIVYYFGSIKFDTDTENTPDTNRDTFLLLGIICAICVLLARVAFAHDAATKATAAELNDIRFDQERIEKRIQAVESQTTKLLRDATWVITPSGLIEYEEYLVK